MIFPWIGRISRMYVNVLLSGSDPVTTFVKIASSFTVKLHVFATGGAFVDVTLSKTFDVLETRSVSSSI